MIVLFAAPALAIGLTFSLAMFFYWRAGFYGLLIYLPFAGTVTLALFPSNLPKIFKDLMFVLPLYFVLVAFHLSAFRSVRLPRSVVIMMLLLAGLVLIQMANPEVVSLPVALVGLKVWLLYLPLAFVTFAFVRDRDDLTRLTRLMVALAVAPCTLGLVQYLQVQATSVVATMTWYYGPAAESASFGFVAFSFGGIPMARIPSTFPFVFQYFGFVFAMLIPAYFVWKSDPSRRWRIFGGGVVMLLLVSGFLSGSRQAFIMLPPLLLMIAILEGRAGRLLIAVPAFSLIMLTAIGIAGFDFKELATDVHARVVSEGGTKKPVIDDFVFALREHTLGSGTGTDTLGARNITADRATPSSVENYWGKAVVELGIPGLLVSLFLFSSILVWGLRVLPRLTDPGLRSFCAAVTPFVALMMVNNLKGFMFDIDPINVYFWVFAGILFRLPSLQRIGGAVPKHSMRRLPRRPMRQAMPQLGEGVSAP